MDSLGGSQEKVVMTISDIFMVLKQYGMPDVLVRNMPHSFTLVPFNTIIRKTYNKDYEPWPYAFVNREKKMYKMNFESFDDLVVTLFTAKEICYGHYPEDAKPNPLYGKSLEQLKIEEDLTNS